MRFAELESTVVVVSSYMETLNYDAGDIICTVLIVGRSISTLHDTYNRTFLRVFNSHPAFAERGGGGYSQALAGLGR